ncbi:MAG: hypothetical protein Q4B44_04020, partial [Erysipelotrichaceae bacterium]|nr:hypothetical protein [Erysipelotrichaceae bacterium]
MRQSRRKTLSALLSFVLLLPMHIVSVSAEDTETEAAEEIQQTSESSEDVQPEMTAEEDQDPELQENEDPQEQQEEQATEQPEPEMSDHIIEEEDLSDAAEDEENQEISDEDVTEFTEEESFIDESQPQDDIPEEDNDTDNNSEEEQEEPAEEIKEPSILYQLHLSNVGWTQNYQNGETSAEGRIEAFRIISEDLNGQISYQSHVQNIGWMSEVSSGAVSGTTGQNRQIEALRIFLSGDAVNEYDVAYRVKIREYGWTGWALNGDQCGSEGYSLSLLGLEVRLVPKGSVESDPDSCFFKKSGMTI